MKISEFAKAANISVETVRYYHRLGVLEKPVATSGYRQYTGDHLHRIRFIQNAKMAGFSLAEIKDFMNFDVVQDRAEMRLLSEQKKTELSAKLRELEAAMAFLDSLITECKESDADSCPIIEGLKLGQ